MNEDWQKLDSEKAARVLSEINPRLEPVPFHEDSTTVRTQRLPFYRGYELVEMTDLSAVPAARKFAIYKPGDVNVIDWTNQAIYETNEKAPVILDENTVVAYAKFFFSYVRGRHGRFLVIETIDDIRWQIEPPLQGRKIMQDMLGPVTLQSKDDDGTFTLEAFMVFKDSLFRTKIHVKKDGLISMSDEELKIEGMPVMQDAARLILPPAAREKKPAFADIPQDILDKIAAVTGQKITGGDIAFGGFSAAASFFLHGQDGATFFAKGCHPQDTAHTTENLRQEIFAYQHVPVLQEIAPKHLGLVSDGDEDGWMLGLWDYVPHAGAQSNTADVIQTLSRIHHDPATHLKPAAVQSYISLFFTPDRKWMRLGEEKTRKEFLALFADTYETEHWLQKNLPVLVAHQQRAQNIPPQGLVHGDLHPDNIFTGADQKIRVIDWPNACKGPAAFDLLILFASWEQAGRGLIETHLDIYEQSGGRPTKQDDRIALAASLSGFMADQARRAVPDKLPRLRWMQARILQALLEYLARQGIVESVTGITNR